MSFASTSYSLDRPLPPDAVAAKGSGLASYRNYPVFGLPWLIRRTAVFGTFAAGLGILSGLGNAIASGDWEAGTWIGFYSAAAFVTMVTIGPALATGVRYLSFSQPVERTLVAGAILLGLGISYAADAWASEHVIRLGKFELPKGQPATPEPIGQIFSVMFLALLYFLLGGGLAAKAYLTEVDRWSEAQRTREMSALRRQKTEADMRLAVLQAQVEPHFLFNTLASVRSLVRQEPARAEAMIEALTDYLRAAIPQLRAQGFDVDVTLGRQLDMAESFLKLMQVRMGGRLSYAIEAEPSLRAHDFPPLTLISLVENAIKHGIEPKAGPGRVTVRAAKVLTDRGARLEIAVEDDGQGLQAGMGAGVGLANVREQLKARFGDAATFDVRNRSGGGVVATIGVPA